MKKLVFLMSLAFAYNSHAITFDRLSINGYLGFEFESQLNESKEGVGQGDTKDSFDMDIFDLVFNFKPTEKTRISADLSWEHGATSESSAGNILVEYSFVEHTITDAAVLRAGKFLTPFGYFNEIHTAKPATLSVKEASATNKTSRIVRNGKRFNARWITGIGAKGNVFFGSSKMDYDVIYGNGGDMDQDFDASGVVDADDNPHDKNQNKTHAVVARTRFYPLDGMTLGLSHYSDAELLEQTEVVSTGLYFNYLYKNQYEFKAEYVTGELKETGEEDLTQVGYFVQLAYYHSSGLTPYLRFDNFDPNTDNENDAGTDITVGANYALDDAINIKAEYHKVEGESKAQVEKGNETGGDWDEIRIALAVGF